MPPISIPKYRNRINWSGYLVGSAVVLSEISIDFIKGLLTLIPIPMIGLVLGLILAFFLSAGVLMILWPTILVWATANGISPFESLGLFFSLLILPMGELIPIVNTLPILSTAIGLTFYIVKRKDARYNKKVDRFIAQIPRMQAEMEAAYVQNELELRELEALEIANDNRAFIEAANDNRAEEEFERERLRNLHRRMRNKRYA